MSMGYLELGREKGGIEETITNIFTLTFEVPDVGRLVV